MLLSECGADPAIVRRAFSLFPSGVAVLIADVDGIPRVLAAGDHDVVLLRVHSLAVDADAEPLVFHGSLFRGLRPAYNSTTEPAQVSLDSHTRIDAGRRLDPKALHGCRRHLER